MTLTEFVLARIAEDEAVARAAIEDDMGQDGGFEDGFDHLTRGVDAAGPLAFTPRFGEAAARMIVWNTPRRVLAECEAKRAIVGYHSDGGRTGGWRGDPSAEIEHACQCCGEFDEFGVPWPCDTIKALALPYADHPDYLPEWKP